MSLKKDIKRLVNRPIKENVVLGLSIVKVNVPSLLKPQTCVLVLTGRCNLRCRMCSYYLKEYAELSTEKWKSIIDDLKANGFARAVFQGGEVLLRRDWHEIVSYARDRGFLTALTTNGVLVDAFMDKIDVFDSFVFSIDSLKIHDEIRGKKGTFERAVANMRAVVKKGYPVYIDAVLQKDNYREIPDFVRFAKGENVMLNLVYPLINSFDDTVPHNDELRQFDFDELRALLSDALKYDWVLNVMEFYELCIQTTFREMSRQCLAPRMKIIVQPDGRIFPCCGPLPSIGDISATPFKQIYDSKAYTDVRKKAYDGTLRGCWRCVSDSIQPSFYTFRNLVKRFAGT